MITIHKLTMALEFLIRGHPQALKVLTGECPPPECEDIMEIYAMLGSQPEDLGLRVDTSKISCPQEGAIMVSECFTEIIEGAGGWDHITLVVRDFRTQRNLEWKLFCAHVAYVDKSRQRTSGSVLDKISDRYGVHPKTIQVKRHEVPYEIAKAALILPIGGF